MGTDILIGQLQLQLSDNFYTTTLSKIYLHIKSLVSLETCGRGYEIKSLLNSLIRNTFYFKSTIYLIQSQVRVLFSFMVIPILILK